MATSKKTHLELIDGTEGTDNSAEQSRVRMKSRDPDLRALEDAQEQWRGGDISEQEYIERAIATIMREVDPLMSGEEREDVARGLRFICNTSPEMRTRLGLDPFGDDD